MNIITRRAFMKTMGLLSLLGVSPDILNSLDCHATEFEDRDKNETSIPACFIGVGDFGQKISKALKKSSHYDPSNRQNQFHFQNEIAMLDSTDNHFDLNRFQEPLIFLAGHTLDPNFWTVRNNIMSKNTELIITTAITGAEIGIRGRPKNEFWIDLSVKETLNTTVNIIKDVYHSINLPGLVNFDAADYYKLSSSIGFGISMESSIENIFPEIKNFVKQHSNVLKKCQKLFILILSFNYTADLEIDYLAELSKLTEIVCDAVDNDEIGINWCAINDLKMNTKFRATIVGC